MNDDFRIVGIGASAGGVDALEELFELLPADLNLAYVIVQHLSPDFESLMQQIVARRTNMKVETAKDGVKVRSNTVYILPEAMTITIEDQMLRLLKRTSQRNSASRTIDSFFESLAEDQAENGIAIVLSGTGADGAEGVKQVHDAGGIVLVQDPQTAKFGDMPTAAIDTGTVNVVGSLKEIVNQLKQIHKREFVASNSSTSSDHPSEVVHANSELNSILAILRSNYSLDFSAYKTSALKRKLMRRISACNIGSLVDYVQHLRDEPHEVHQLYNSLLAGTAPFFQNVDVFEGLKSSVINEIIEKNRKLGEVRIWISPTSTGEEAYSVAILIDEVLQEKNLSMDIKIFATDVLDSSVESAGRGVFEESALINVSPERRGKYFSLEADGFHICRHIRKQIVFAGHDLLRDAPFTSLDLVLCRNFLLYLKPDAQRRVLSLLNFGLKDSGLLVLGVNESVAPLETEFQCIDERVRIFRKTQRIRSSQLTPTVTTARPITGNLKKVTTGEQLVDSYSELLNQFVPPSLLMKLDRQLLHIFSGANRFLNFREGRPSSDVLQMLPDQLRVAVSNGLKRANTSKKKVVYTGLQCEIDGKTRTYRTTVQPITNQRDKRTDFLVSFEDTGIVLGEAIDSKNKPAQLQRERLSLLEEELRETRESLHASIQELKTANEEMQSTNEELIASNEELQSTNEELHSVNEELYTVNAEHQRKIVELTELTDDMENLLDSIRVDTVFLDRDLNIRRYTLGIAKTFRLMPQDIGRSIETFNHDLKYKRLTEDIQCVLRSEEALEREVQDRSESWFLMRILPYTSRGRVDGVLITLIDITKIKSTEKKLAELSEIVEFSDDAIFRVEPDGVIRTWNRGAANLYGYSSHEVCGESLYKLIPNEMDKVKLQQALELSNNAHLLDHVQMQHLRKDGCLIDVSITISPMSDLSENNNGASIVIRDISVETKAKKEIQRAIKRRDEFLAMLSHELRNPLAAILNAYSLLREKNVDQKTTEEAKHVAETQLKHLASLLDDLLDVSRITNDKIRLKLEVMDIKRSMLEALECVRHSFDEKEQSVAVEAPDEELYVLGDTDRLQQAQVNLLNNASKYTPVGGHIQLSLSKRGKDAVVTVTDNGIGIPDELASSAFDLFVQAHQTLDRSQGGMGLGLPLVRSIAESHGGSVQLVSSGKSPGCTFELKLPLTDQRPAKSKPCQDVVYSTKRILLIEDNDDIRKMLARSLQLKGMQVADAPDAKSGLQEYHSFQPEIVIVDIGLPDIDGYEVAKLIRNSTGDTHTEKELGDAQPTLVAVTGYGREEDKQQAREAGFDLHLVKPINPTELLEQVHSLQPMAPKASRQ